MANVINNDFHNLSLKLNYDEYWDFFLNKDAYFGTFGMYDGSFMYDKCLISYVDPSLEGCVDGKLLRSTNSYQWEKGVSNGQTLYNIGYCGLDNGFIEFRKDKHNNASFQKLYSNSTYELPYEDNRLRLHQVSGGTNLYEYPISIEDGIIKLNGGFYQGFFETKCNEYAVLPSQLNSGDVWNFEFLLKKEDFKEESEKTLNGKYPNNKGIFFYLGTRAENKWVYLYNNDESESDDTSSEYADGLEVVSDKDYIIDMINPNPVFVDWSKEAMDDYLTNKYYSDSLYQTTSMTDDDFLGNYVVMREKPILINEEKEYGQIITWGQTKGIKVTQPYDDATCDCYRYVKNIFQDIEEMEYVNSCDLFGDDYLEDFESEDYLLFDDDIDISDFDWETNKGLKLLKRQYYIETDNKFLLFDRTCDGFNVYNWEEGSIGRYYGDYSSFKENLFLLMNRTCTGYTVYNIDELRQQYKKEYNIYNDLFNNALAFRITDEGKIGYRYLTLDCDNLNGHDGKYTIEESYSKENIVKEGEWSMVNIKIRCALDKMKIYIYVNGNLVFASKFLPKLNLRKLHEEEDKQEGVAYNISLGGGTQGLCDTILPNYMAIPNKIYPLELNFGGTFIGYMKWFKMYDCLLESSIIRHNYKFGMRTLTL